MSDRDLRDLLAQAPPAADSRACVDLGQDGGAWSASFRWLLWDVGFFGVLFAAVTLGVWALRAWR